jgi:hypothetical protein
MSARRVFMASEFNALLNAVLRKSRIFGSVAAGAIYPVHATAW